MIWAGLFLGFLKVGLFSFGGAYGAIPLIRDVVLSSGWLDDDMLASMIAVSEVTPGPVMINLATYIGSDRAGFLGALTATFAVVLPSFLIIFLVFSFCRTFMEKKWVQAVLQSVKPCMIGIVMATGLCMLIGDCLPGIPVFRADKRNIAFLAMLLLFLYARKRMLKKKCPPIGLICLSALMGAVFF